MGATNLNGREYTADVLQAAVEKLCSGVGLPSLMLLDHATPGRDEMATIEFVPEDQQGLKCVVGEISTAKLMETLSGIRQQTEAHQRDRIRDAWLRGYTQLADLSNVEMITAKALIDGTIPKLLGDVLSVKTMHPAFAMLTDSSLGLAEDGTQDECKESIEQALDSAVDNHLQIIAQGLSEYQMKVVEHTIEYTPPRLRLKVKTARPRIQVNGIMTGGIIRRLMNAWVTVTVYNTDAHPKDHFSKTYEYHSGLVMRHTNMRNAEENEGAHFDAGDEEFTHFDLVNTRGLDPEFSRRHRFQVFGTVSGRIQPPKPLMHVV